MSTPEAVDPYPTAEAAEASLLARCQRYVSEALGDLGEAGDELDEAVDAIVAARLRIAMARTDAATEEAEEAEEAALERWRLALDAWHEAKIAHALELGRQEPSRAARGTSS